MDRRTTQRCRRLLPLHDASGAAVVLVNAFVFPTPSVTTWRLDLGQQQRKPTPIYLSGDGLLAVLPGERTGASSRAGEGHWYFLRRA
jgi:hypothetical protein